MHKKNMKKGFTLVELLTVVVIIGLLAAFVVPKIFSNLGKTKKDIARAKMALIENSIARFQLDCGRIPTQDEGIEALIVPPPELEDKWSGRYAKQSEIIDPWGNAYIYIEQGEINIGSYDLISLGADGTEGGEGENEDIYNE